MEITENHQNKLKDKNWRLSNLYTIRDKKQKTIPFVVNKAQAHFNQNKHTRNIILKSRQLGFTTLESIDMLDEAIFSKNFNGLIISKEKDIATETFKDKIYYAWMHLDKFIKERCNVSTDRANQLEFDFGDGTFSKLSVQSSGRAGTYNRVHISELGYLSRKYPEKTREIIRGTLPSVPIEGRVDIESTAEGEQGVFYEMFWNAYSRGEPTRQSQYKAHFYNWRWDYMGNTQIIPLEEMDQQDRFEEVKEKHKLTELELSYYYDRWISLNQEWNSLKQEYPITPEEAFIASGDKTFDMEKVEKLKKHTKEGEKVGDWIYYEEYQPGHRYALGADVSEGIGKDSSTIVVIDFTPIKPVQVAEFHSNRIDPVNFAYEIKNGGTRFGNCLVGVENNYFGHTTLQTLKGMYHNIYKEERSDSTIDEPTTKLGWKTTATTKPKMLFDLKSAINNEEIILVSKWLIDELRTHTQDDIGQIKFDDEQSRHWDRLMALSIAYQMKNHVGLDINPDKLVTNYRLNG